MGQLFTNNASSTLLSNIGAGDTVVTVQAGDGELFPVIAASGDFFVVTLEDTFGNIEIMTCTARTADALTVVRGAEGTPPQAFTAGDRVELRSTAETLSNFAQRSGDTFTGLVTVPSLDIVTSDQTAYDQIQVRYQEINGVPELSFTGPLTTPSRYLYKTYKAANETWDFGIDENGRQIGTGATRHYWYEKQTADADWYIDETTTRPAADEMQLEYRPGNGAISVSYLWEVIDAAGVKRQIKFNTDGSITAQGAFEFGSLTLPLEDDPTAEKIQIGFRIGGLIFGSDNRRTLEIRPDNISGDAGGTNTAVQYRLYTRDDLGNEGSVSIYGNGTVWASGDGVFTSVTVSDQGTGAEVGPQELTTKALVEQLITGGGVAAGYFSERLYDSASGVGSGSFSLANPLSVTGSVKYQQVMFEAYFPNGGPAYSSITLSTADIRTGTNYTIGPAFQADATGNLRFNISANYQTVTVTSENGAVLRRVVGVSFSGDPFP